MVGRLLRNLNRAYAKYGLLGTLHRCWDFAYWKAWRFTPAGRKAARKARATDLDFDRTHGVDTGGISLLSGYDIKGESWIYGNYYEAIAPHLFREVLSSTGIEDYQPYRFIDMGAGKGRAILLASEHPFHEIVGIEFAPELAAQARSNVAQFQHPSQRCGNLTVLEMDALKYDLPPGPTILYLYNPFQEPLMARLVERVTGALENSPRDFLVLYVNPEHDHLWRQARGWQRIAGDDRFSIHRHVFAMR